MVAIKEILDNELVLSMLQDIFSTFISIFKFLSTLYMF